MSAYDVASIIWQALAGDGVVLIDGSDGSVVKFGHTVATVAPRLVPPAPGAVKGNGGGSGGRAL